MGGFSGAHLIATAKLPEGGLRPTLVYVTVAADSTPRTERGVLTYLTDRLPSAWPQQASEWLIGDFAGCLSRVIWLCNFAE